MICLRRQVGGATLESLVTDSNSSISDEILIVDDTPANLRLLSNLLTEQGYKVRLAPNGKLALMNAHADPPDLILLDILMPDMDGFEVCRRLKADDKVCDIPVLFISALNEVFDKVTAFSVGGVDYITKPFQVEEVLARVRAHLRLHKLQWRLEEQNQELEAFAHTVAHDLKSPLQTMLGYLDVLREDAVEGREISHEMLDTAVSGVSEMNNIIDELLLLASVRKEDIEVGPVHMQAIVEQALGRLEHMIARYQPKIILPDSWPTALGYAPWIEEVWVNYLSNGLKYGGNPPTLQLGSDSEYPGTVRFWLRDNGEGLDPAAQAELFAEFTRLDKVRAQGHGLGLSIVRRIAEKLGGQVGIESAPGEGSLFFFTLPPVNENL